MNHFKKELEIIANVILAQNADAKFNENKPNYSNRDFMNCLIIFQNALMDKMYDNQEFDNMPIEQRIEMAESSGKKLREFIFTYTGLDTHQIDKFI